MLVLACVFSVSYLGFNVSNTTKKLAGKTVSISTVTLGKASSAYCNEAMFWGEFNAGVCTAAMNNPNSECLNVVSNTHNCVL